VVGVGVSVGVCFADTDLDGSVWQAVTDTVSSNIKMVAMVTRSLDRMFPIISLIPSFDAAQMQKMIRWNSIAVVMVATVVGVDLLLFKCP